MNPYEHAASGAPAFTEQRSSVLVAEIKCDACGRRYYSAAVPRLSRPLPACPDCGGSQRLVDLIVG
jgi:NAD-dependent SIR2 family protein deacetylase